MATKKSESVEITVLQLQQGVLDVCILGTSPIILNRVSEKAKRELLAPKGRKNAAERASTMKHNPVEEFRDAPYRLKDPKAPTLLGVPPTGFKKGLCTVALDMPDASKAQLGRLVSVEWGNIPIWGIPKLFMAIVRSKDQNRTPDVRTRAMLPEWACRLTLRYLKPQLTQKAVADLLAAAGVINGLGDWRQEKGSGAFGSYRMCNADDPDFLRIVADGGRAAQIAAMEQPECFDDESSELLTWFEVEVKKRGRETEAKPPRKSRSAQPEEMAAH